jgi:hypothetical protein
MDGYDLIVLIPWGIFGIAFILLCVWLQVSSRRSQRDQAPPARRGAAATAELADGHDAALPGQERVPVGTSGPGLRRSITVSTPVAPAAVADARIPSEPCLAPGPRASAKADRVLAVVAVSAPGGPNRRPAWRG